jgi:D-alanyl-D-alanine carboxypeptidase/D-alanyl-D-alanine-endopeptidase (penicillin-binding protein 4)
LPTYATTALLALSACCTAQTLTAPKVRDPEISVGVSVVSVRDKKVVLARDEQKLFTPSSTAKVLTIAAALHYLGPAYRYDTGFYASQKKGSQIQDLVLKASGDPSFSSADLTKLVTEVHQLGIRSIKGNIVIDTSVFDDVPYGKGWMLDDLNEGYSAPISGISIDHNRIAFGLIPSPAPGDPIAMTMFPSSTYVSVVNRAKTAHERSKRGLTLTHPEKQGVAKGTAIVVEGQAPASSFTTYETLSVNDPVDYAGFLIQEELKKNGISFKGKVIRGNVPQKMLLLTHHFSAPLSEMAIDFVKMSNNHAAETLLKSIAFAQNGAPATFENGLAAVKHFLESKAGVHLGEMVMADGSGLSRYNQISAKHLTDLLSFMWNDFRTGPEFVASLALYGEDGTLKTGKGNSLVGSVRAKTGSMSNLKSLAGYIRRENGEVLAFAILTSGSTANKQQRVIEDILTSIKNGTPIQ